MQVQASRRFDAGHPHAEAALISRLVWSLCSTLLFVFLQVAPQPSWQSAAVASFLSSGALNPGPSNFNPAGRAYPDLAAAAHNVIIWTDGTAGQVDGTSCVSASARVSA